ncbi:MAG: peptide chain release factor N(5)-glutamine methyltransferase [Deltaproteobacteria bacterium]|nr:MAG: peptide chain release factor N(5)-glutamine methyltransferase [Deltaproteobacteria bacterium]
MKDALLWTASRFERAGFDSPRLDAEVLLAHVLGCDRVRLYMDYERPLDADERAAYRALVRRRLAGEPVAYLVGFKEFWSRRFQVDRRVLVPRPETEHLVEAALERIPPDAPARVLDLCSGSGCVGITVALERPLATVVGVDLSAAACEVARENAQALGAKNYQQLEGDLYAPCEGSFHLVTANPPYVAHGDPQLDPAVARYEPEVALFAGSDGLRVLRRIVAGAPAHIEPGGWLLLEHGPAQDEALRTLLRDWEEVTTRSDLAGRPRITAARRPAAGAARQDPGEEAH